MIIRSMTIVRNDKDKIDIALGQGFLTSGQVIHLENKEDILPFISETLGINLVVSRAKKGGK